MNIFDVELKVGFAVEGVEVQAGGEGDFAFFDDVGQMMAEVETDGLYAFDGKFEMLAFAADGAGFVDGEMIESKKRFGVAYPKRPKFFKFPVQIHRDVFGGKFHIEI